MIRFRKQSHSRGPRTIPPGRLPAGYAAVLLLIALTAESCSPTAGGFNVRGNAVYAKGNYDEAIRLYRKSLALKPRLPAVNANLGWAYFHKKNYDEAVVYLKRSLSYKPEYKHAMRGLARALFRKKDYKEALRYFRRIVEADPGAVEELDYVGWSHLNMENYDLAIPAHRRVLSRKPRHQSVQKGKVSGSARAFPEAARDQTEIARDAELGGVDPPQASTIRRGHPPVSKGPGPKSQE
ncbi:MAG: tetratricopeptide repeat protein [Nitrospinota bacterium]|jgi:tetratricopeptide (TPR) repeat protein|nr:tetratricopeptide repeat protein [Nitrospinota bacterium]